MREVFRLIGDDMAYRELGEQALSYALTWIQQFVLSKCERGRGTRPRCEDVVTPIPPMHLAIVVCCCYFCLDGLVWV